MTASRRVEELVMCACFAGAFSNTNYSSDDLARATSQRPSQSFRPRLTMLFEDAAVGFLLVFPRPFQEKERKKKALAFPCSTRHIAVRNTRCFVATKRSFAWRKNAHWEACLLASTGNNARWHLGCEAVASNRDVAVQMTKFAPNPSVTTFLA